jgi:hypothetical protein
VIDEFLDEIAGAKFFSSIDLAFEFHQIRMAPIDEARHFQFRVMPFGFTNAPNHIPVFDECHFREIHEKICFGIHG